MTIDVSPQAAALDRTAALLAKDPQIQRATPKPDVVTAARTPGPVSYTHLTLPTTPYV